VTHPSCKAAAAAGDRAGRKQQVRGLHCDAQCAACNRVRRPPATLQVIYSWHSQRRGEKRWHVVVSWALAGCMMAILPTVMHANTYAGFAVFILCTMWTCEWLVLRGFHAFAAHVFCSCAVPCCS